MHCFTKLSGSLSHLMFYVDKNYRGPRIEPCGTPHCIVLELNISVITNIWLFCQPQTIFGAWIISLMYIKKSNGPRIEPCGTPHCILLAQEQESIELNELCSIWKSLEFHNRQAFQSVRLVEHLRNNEPFSMSGFLSNVISWVF